VNFVLSLHVTYVTVTFFDIVGRRTKKISQITVQNFIFKVIHLTDTRTWFLGILISFKNK